MRLLWILSTLAALWGCTHKLKPILSSQGPLSNMKPVTFSGTRSGEGYFDPSGRWMVFQSERPLPQGTSPNPFYQIYLHDRIEGGTKRISPGVGKTTCSWIHPLKNEVLFSSTHLDPDSQRKQKTELDQRAKGEQKRYAWDYDEHYDIFVSDFSGRPLRRLTKEKGYDAEASFSPDGQWVAYSSNAHAFNDRLGPDEQALFEKDPSSQLEIYIMRADGKERRRLTHNTGYDGGPFFSPDGQRITFRRFTPDGQRAEIFTMNLDGSDQKQITRLNAMSWAPFYHPSGDYLVFTTSLLGHSNFELYIVDVQGEKEPARVSFLDGFDGLPVFLPHGNQLSWTRRDASGGSQIYIANWNDDLARSLLALPRRPSDQLLTSAEITDHDLRAWVKYLASTDMKGRATGSTEEKIYTQKIADFFSKNGLTPAGSKGSFFQEFDFASGVELGPGNSLQATIPGSRSTPTLSSDWLPLTISQNHSPQSASGLVFAGYGIRAPATEKYKAYDSFKNLDVRGKWVLMFRFVPEAVPDDFRIHLNRYSMLHHKIMMARDLGALGVVFVSGPNSGAKRDLIPFGSGLRSSPASLPAFSISDHLAAEWLESEGQRLASLQTSHDGIISPEGFEFKSAKLSVQIDLKRNRGLGRNVLGVLRVPGAQSTLVIGAHGDHLGKGHVEGSFLSSEDKTDIHYGADDNASGVAALMELVEKFRISPAKSQKSNLLFAVWSGEEIGILGSNHFLKEQNQRGTLNISAYINMDMIGRLRGSQLSLQGVASSPDWTEIIESVLSQDLALHTSADPYLPTDSMAFYLSKIPSITFFTGSHHEYHTPRDTYETINFDGLTSITHYVFRFASQVAQFSKLRYKEVPQSNMSSTRGFRIFLGTIPDYTQTDSKGVALSGVIKGGPAEKAGLRSGDVILKLSSYKIDTIYDYVYSLQAIRPGQPTTILVRRGDKTQEISITPQSKE